MKKIFFKSIIFGLGVMSLTACSDAADEITSIIYGRNFSPVGLEAKSIDESTAVLDWTVSDEAGAYVIEVYADDSLTFAGTPVQTIACSKDQIPYSLSNLVYDTQYSARVQSKDTTDTSRDSKWTAVAFRTSAQQLLKNPKTDEIADRSVILTFEAGEEYTSIEVNQLDADGNIVSTTSQALTAEEIEAGSATVENLTPETTYEFRLLNGTKERGDRKVTTIMDLNGAITVRTSDDLRSIIESAEEGAKLALYPGTYKIAGTDDDGNEVITSARIGKTITIQSIYPTDVATIKGRFQLEDGAGLTISDIKLDGSENSTTDQCFNYKTADANYAALNVEKCDISGYEKGVYYLNVAATVESISFNNCLIHDITCDGGDLFDARKGLIKSLSFSNSTIYNCAQDRDFIRMDKNSGSYTETSKISLTNCTINNVCNNTAKKRFFYVRFDPAEITMSNCIVSNTLAVFSNQSATPVPTFTNNAYYTVPNLLVLDLEGKSNLFIDETATVGDPAYADAANGDFTLGNDSFVNYGMGDPRWY